MNGLNFILLYIVYLTNVCNGYKSCTSCSEPNDNTQCLLYCNCQCTSKSLCDNINSSAHMMIAVNNSSEYIYNISTDIQRICEIYKTDACGISDCILYAAGHYSSCDAYLTGYSCQKYYTNMYYGTNKISCNTDIICSKVKELIEPITILYPPNTMVSNLAYKIMKDCSSAMNYCSNAYVLNSSLITIFFFNLFIFY